MICCFIALGSNLEQPLKQVISGASALKQLPDTKLITVSPWYQSTAIGPGDQPDYINGVAEILTTLEPLVLLNQLQDIEKHHLRKRIQRWGPRTLDLDILLYGNEVINLPSLSIPHPRMNERNFVLYPLADIAPSLTLPTGASLKSQLKQCPMDDLWLADTIQPPKTESDH